MYVLQTHHNTQFRQVVQGGCFYAARWGGQVPSKGVGQWGCFRIWCTPCHNTVLSSAFSVLCAGRDGVLECRTHA